MKNKSHIFNKQNKPNNYEENYSFLARAGGYSIHCV